MQDLINTPDYNNDIKNISFNQYMKILNIRLDSKLEPTDKLYNILSVLSGLDYDVINELDLNPLTFLTDKYKFINDIIKVEDFKPVLSFKHNEIIYDIKSEPSTWNFRMFIDLEVIQEKYKENIIEALPYFLYILSVPEYTTSSETFKMGDKFKDLPISIVFGVYSFFLQRKMRYMELTTHSSILMGQVNQQVQSIETLVRNGVGQNKLKNYLTEIYWSKIKFSMKISTTFLIISATQLMKIMLTSLNKNFFNK